MRHEYWPTKGNVPVMQGSRPWSGGIPENKKDIVREKQYSKGDSPEEIEDCLWCWLPECKNCIPLKRKKARELAKKKSAQEEQSPNQAESKKQLS